MNNHPSNPSDPGTPEPLRQPAAPGEPVRAEVVPEPPAAIEELQPRSLLGSVWFAFKMVEIRLRFVAILVAIGLVIGFWDTIQNVWDKWTRPAGAAAALSADDEFYCPMHPSVVRGEPDAGGATPKCPICGMPLSKRKKGAPVELPDGIISRVQLSPYRVELAGIKTVEAALRPMSLDVRTVGYVVIDERRLSRIVVRIQGYVEKLYVNESFAKVRQGDPLAEIYSPQLVSAAQELLVASRSRSTAGSDLAAISRDKLRLLGVADEEIDKIVRTGKPDMRLVIRSEQVGHVFEKRVVEGDSVQAGQTLFEIADLSTVWIEGEVFEKDAAMLRNGQTVEATVEAYPGRVFQGRVGLVHPHVETATRTVRVRFELDNPGHLLRPGMFATVSLATPMQAIEPFRSQLAALAMDSVPMIAVADDGELDSHEDGAEGHEATADNEPQPVDDAALIAMQKFCPVTGLKLGSMGKPIRANAGGRTVFLCCTGCVDKLAADPDYYLRRLTTVSDEGVLAVPERAVIDTGNLKVVYIEREPGLFEGVAVAVGPLAGGYYPVIDGLLAGDRVAANGAFLVDAETRLNPAAGAAYFGASGTPSTGGSAAPSTTRSPGTGPDKGSEAPSEKARANLSKLPGPDRQRAEQQRICPITNLTLGSMGVPYKMTAAGQTLFLCCDGCEDEVNEDPQAALAKIQKLKSQR